MSQNGPNGKMSIGSLQNLLADWGNIEYCVPAAFTGATGNSRGDKDGSLASFPLFTVTGDVIIRLFGVCTVDLAGASGTVEVGTVLSTANIIAQTTATDLDAGDLWHDNSPDNNVELDTVAAKKFLVNGATIKEKVATTDIASGNIYYVCGWYPLSYDGMVKSAVV